MATQVSAPTDKSADTLCLPVTLLHACMGPDELPTGLVELVHNPAQCQHAATICVRCVDDWLVDYAIDFDHAQTGTPDNTNI